MMQAYKEAFCEEIRETLFSPQILQERIARMEEKIRDIESTMDGLARQCKLMLIQTINVALFSYMIAKNERNLGDDFNLLLEAAKYHDSGINERYRKADLENEKASLVHIVQEDELAEKRR